jgi:hypothetical protein
MTMKIFVAELETRSTLCHGFGSDPVEAVAALVARWRDDWCPRMGADPALVSDFRGDISVSEAELGKGYVSGSNDFMARPTVARGDAPEFDAVFAPSPSRGRGMRR